MVGKFIIDCFKYTHHHLLTCKEASTYDKKLISLLLTCCMLLPTITALAAIQTYMYFDSNGGTPVDPVPATVGMLVSEPEPPIREGFTFGGWYLDKF